MPHYDFGVEFQDQIVSLLLRKNRLISQLRSVVKPEYFSDPLLRSIISHAIDFTTKYQVIPSNTEFIEYVRKNGGDKYEVDRIKSVVKVKWKSEYHIIDQITEFAQFQSMREAIIESTELLDSSENRIQIKKNITEALKVGIDTRQVGINLFEDKNRIALRLVEGLDEGKIPTGLGRLDMFMEGGLGPGELGIILAPPKGFKTGTLVNLGAAAVNSRHKVIHFTLEVSAKRMALRYDRRFAGLDKKEIITSSDKLESMLKRIGNLGGGLIIKEYPMRSVTIEKINAHVDFLKAEGFDPDMIIIDYGDIAKSSIRGEKRDQLSQIYADMRGMAQEHKVSLWSASQANRKSLGNKVIRAEDIAESFDKVAIADIIIAVCQTKEERKLKPARARYFVAVSREGEGGGIVYTSIDYDKMRIRQLDEDFEEETDD